MRLVIDTLTALMLVMLLAGVVWAHRTGRQVELAQQRVYNALAALHEQAVYRGALGDAELSDTGFPKQISPNWFGETIPFNHFADARRPWIDVAPSGDQSDHPPDPVFTGDSVQAGFWYNPTRGIFRARVPALTTDDQTLALYNEINNAGLDALPRQNDPARQPIAHTPLPATTARAADTAVVTDQPAQQPRLRSLRAD